ncbi:DMT family transporter [Breoghania sp. JC706]|uniref:DMT family transporter n=1 Tax=Breoghania sp. JC706 TaxID=3117732 RepID=UPI00300AC135
MSGLCAALIWGGFPVVTRLGVTSQSLDAWDVAFIRFTVAALVTLPYLMKHGFGFRPVGAVVLMVAGIGVPYILTIAQGLSSAPVRLFAAVTPPMMVGLSTLLVSLLYRRLPPRAVLAGVAVIVVGVTMMGATSLLEDGASPLGAYLLFLLGALLWAGFTVTTKETGISAMKATALVSFWSAVCLWPVYLWLKGTAIVHVPLDVIATQAIYQGILVSVGALFFYSTAVRALGAIAGSTFAALVPGFATVWAAVLLGEVPSAFAIVSIAVVSTGMIVTLLAGARRRV